MFVWFYRMAESGVICRRILGQRWVRPRFPVQGCSESLVVFDAGAQGHCRPHTYRGGGCDYLHETALPEAG